MLKRILTALTAALTLFSTASAASIAVNFEGVAALIDESGAEYVAPGTYDFIFALDKEGALFCGGGGVVNGEYCYALLNAQGEPLTQQAYAMFSQQGEAIIFTKDGLYGAMDLNGEILVEPVYTQLVANGEGGFVGLTTDCFDEEADGLYLVDAQGGQTATGVRTTGMLDEFSGGLMPLMSAQNNLYGYIDTSGQWAVRPQFAYAGSFSGERAAASLSTGYGLIDNTGNWVITPKYDELTCLEGELVFAVDAGQTAIGFDPETLEERFTIELSGAYAAAFGGLVCIYDEDAPARLYDYDGRLIYESTPLATYAAGLCGQTILTDGEWGEACCRLIGQDGALVGDGAWQSLFPLFEVDGAGYYGFMSFDVTPVYSELLGRMEYDWDIDSVRYGVIDHTGATVLEDVYDEISAAVGNRLLVRKGEACGVIDIEGNWIYQLDLARE